MPRKVQDIIPGNRRSVRDIPLSHLPSHLPDKESKKEIKELMDDNQVVSKKFPWPFIIIGVVVVIAGIAFAFSGHFAHATFTLVPRTVPVHVNSTYIISKKSSGAFGYEIMTLKGIASTTVPAQIGAYTESKAQGTMRIYNSYSASSQRLVAGTRFSGQSGLVYRLTSSIIVPGYKKSGSTITPGSVSATIVADMVGDMYNISNSDSISDMKIIAYKGTAKYDAFYGRLTSDVTGGFAGTRTVISPTLLASTTSKIQNDLSTRLYQQMKTIIPDGYVMFDDTYSSIYDPYKVSSVSSSTALLTVGATVYGVMFKKADLIDFLGGASSTASFGTFGYTSPDISSISFSIANKSDFSAIKSTNLAARINGSFNIVGSIPVADIQKRLSGITLSQTSDVLSKYSSVIDLSKSTGEISPPWVTVVPKDINRVLVTVKN